MSAKEVNIQRKTLKNIKKCRMAQDLFVGLYRHLFFLDVPESSNVIRSIRWYTGNNPST